MLKQVTAFVFLLAFVTQTFYKAFIVMDYYTNTASFARNCENKARPQLHCNGTCQLVKKLKKEEKKDQENAERRFNKYEVMSSKSFFPSTNSPVLKLIASIKIPSHSDGSPIDRTFDIFQPPKA